MTLTIATAAISIAVHFLQQFHLLIPEQQLSQPCLVLEEVELHETKESQHPVNGLRLPVHIQRADPDIDGHVDVLVDRHVPLTSIHFNLETLLCFEKPWEALRSITVERDLRNDCMLQRDDEVAIMSSSCILNDPVLRLKVELPQFMLLFFHLEKTSVVLVEDTFRAIELLLISKEDDLDIGHPEIEVRFENCTVSFLLLRKTKPQRWVLRRCMLSQIYSLVFFFAFLFMFLSYFFLKV